MSGEFAQAHHDAVAKAFAESLAHLAAGSKPPPIVLDAWRDLIGLPEPSAPAERSPLGPPLGSPSPTCLVDRLGEQLLESALKVLTEQRNYGDAALLVQAFVLLRGTVVRSPVDPLAVVSG